MLNKRLQLKKLQADLQDPKNLKEDECRIEILGRIFEVFVDETSVTVNFEEARRKALLELFTKEWLASKKAAIEFAYKALKSFEKVGIDQDVSYFHDDEVEDIFKKYMQRPGNK